MNSATCTKRAFANAELYAKSYTMRFINRRIAKLRVCVDAETDVRMKAAYLEHLGVLVQAQALKTQG